MQSKANTVDEYLAELPQERQHALKIVRKEILKNLPKGYEEVMNWGMITYQIPLSQYPNTYNKKPLMYAALASQKNHMAVYLLGIYSSEESRNNFEKEYKQTGKRFDMGKSCVRFKNIDNLPLKLIGKAIAMLSVDDMIQLAESAKSSRIKS